MAESPDLLKYYRLKAGYEDKLAKKKRAIMADRTLSQEEKRRRVARLTGRCPQCKQPGGLRFTRKGTQLVAACAASPQCDFTLTVDRGNEENIRRLEAGVAGEVKRLESDVIRTKLDLLFGYSSQAEAVAHFDGLRPRLKTVGDRLEELRRRYWRTVTRSGDQPALKTARADLAVSRAQLASMDPEAAGAARTAAAVYVDTIRPLVEKIRRLKYARSAVHVEQSEDPAEEVDVLELEPYTLNQLMVPSPPEDD